MDNPEPIVVIKRETTPTGQPPVVLITGIFIKHKRPIIVDERRDQSKELMVFDRRSTTAVSKDFSSPGFYPLDGMHGPLLSLLAAVRLLDPVESSQSNTSGIIPPAGIMNNNNNNNQQQQNLPFPMVFPQNNMYYGMPVQPGMPTPMAPPNALATTANLPPQLVPVLQPYLFSQQQQQQHTVNQQQQQQQQQKSSQYQPHSYTQRKPIQHQQQLQQQHTMASSLSSSSRLPNINDIITSTSSARSSPVLVVNSNNNNPTVNSSDLTNTSAVRSSPAQSADGRPTELRNASLSPNNHHHHRIRRKQPQLLPNSTDLSNNHNNNHNNNYINNISSSSNNNSNKTTRRRVRFAKTDQVFSYDVDEDEHGDSHPSEDEQYDYYNDDEEDDIENEDDDDDEYYNDDEEEEEEEEEDIRTIRHRWSPRTIVREQSHDVYNFPSHAPRFPYRRRGRRRWPVVHRPPLHLHHTEV